MEEIASHIKWRYLAEEVQTASISLEKKSKNKVEKADIQLLKDHLFHLTSLPGSFNSLISQYAVLGFEKSLILETESQNQVACTDWNNTYCFGMTKLHKAVRLLPKGHTLRQNDFQKITALELTLSSRKSQREQKNRRYDFEYSFMNPFSELRKLTVFFCC